MPGSTTPISAPGLMVFKRTKQGKKQRQAQVYVLMNDKNAFDEFLADLQTLQKTGEQFAKPSNQSNAELLKKLDKQMHEIIQKVRKQFYYESDELTELFKNPLNEEALVKFLFEKLKKDYHDYIAAKKSTEQALRNSGRAKPYQQSNLLGYAEAIGKLLGGYAPDTSKKEVYNFTWFANIQNKLAVDLKKNRVMNDPEAYFAARQKSALEPDHKRFLVDVWQTHPDSSLYKQELKEAKENGRVPARYGGSPGAMAAMIKVGNYSGRTGYPAADTTQTNLIRAFDIGFSQDEVLKIFRSLNSKISLAHGRGADNPIEKIRFKLYGEEFGVTARLSPDGKKINYLKYKMADLEAWNTATPRGSMEDFINEKATTLTGDECEASLNTPLKYAHRDETYGTVGEALDELAMHLATAANKDVYRSKNLKGYEPSKPGSGVDLDEGKKPDDTAGASAAAGAALVAGKVPAAGATLVRTGSPVLSTDLEDDEEPLESVSGSGPDSEEEHPEKGDLAVEGEGEGEEEHEYSRHRHR